MFLLLIWNIILDEIKEFENLIIVAIDPGLSDLVYCVMVKGKKQINLDIVKTNDEKKQKEKNIVR